MRHPPALSTTNLGSLRPALSLRLHVHHFPRHSRRHYSTPLTPSLIKTRIIPAPHTGHITVLTLSSPSNKNAISRQLLSELSTEIQKIRDQWGYIEDVDHASARWTAEHSQASYGIETTEKEKANSRQKWTNTTMGGAMAPTDVANGTRVLVLGSEVAGVFCAGADLKERKGMSNDETKRFLGDLRGAFSSLATLPIPTISAVSGFALGGGLELALSTSFRVFSSSATVGLPETRLAILPGAGGTFRLRELIGRARASEMILTGRRVSGREAHSLGICERLVAGDAGEDARGAVVKADREEREKTIAAAVKMAEEICEGGPVAVGAALRAVGWGVRWTEREWEDKMYDRVVRTGDRDEALKAFGEKRKPNFTGS